MSNVYQPIKSNELLHLKSKNKPITLFLGHKSQIIYLKAIFMVITGLIYCQGKLCLTWNFFAPNITTFLTNPTYMFAEA